MHDTHDCTKPNSGFAQERRPVTLQECPKELALAVSRMLEKNPMHRPQAPADAALSLEPFLPSSGQRAEKHKVLPEFAKFLEESSFELAGPPPMEPPKTNPPKSRSGTEYRPVKPVSPPSVARQDFVDVELVRSLHRS